MKTMKLKSIIIAALALTGFAGNAWADTDKLTSADGWTKITSVPTSSDIANNYYVFVDATRDLMLGIGKGVHQDTQWYSLGVYYRNSVEPTAKDFIPLTWTLESCGDDFAMRNLDQPVCVFQTEWGAAWKFDTNDVTTPNEWTPVKLTLADGVWTLQNGKYPDSGYIGPWDDNFTNGAECAANKTGNNVGKFHIYAISRAQFKQNLLDNASASNPVDLTPWYVTNATFDANNSNGWETSFTANASNWWGNHAFSNLGAENYQQVAEVKQTLTVPNGKYKVALQGASNKVGENQAYVFATHNGSTNNTYFTQSTVSTIDDNKWNDMQYNLLLMMQNRSYGQVQTPEVTVTTGTLTIGYKNESGHSWDVYDNFKLYCTGVDLSAYQTQLADLVGECNAFISSKVVPDACESAISAAITTYNQSYSTAKEYSNAIVALTAVLNTYRNDAGLQSAYAAFNAFKTKIVGLTTGQPSGTELTTFNTAVSNATTAVEAAATAAAITTQITNLRSAGLTYISSVEGQFDITFLVSQVYSDWKRKDGSAAGIVQDQFLANRPSAIPSFAENFEWTAATTGNVLYQTVEGLPAGYYQVGMYTMALSTSQRDNISTEAVDGDANRTFAFAGDLADATSIQRTGMPIKFATAVNFDDLTTLDVNVHLSSDGSLTFGVQKDANGSNWHFAQIMSIVYSNSPDLTSLKATRDALVAEANGLKNGVDANYLTEVQKGALQDAINAGDAANDFEELNIVTLTTLPNAINTAKQQIAQAKAAVPAMLAALERFESDYNLVDGTDYSRVTMSEGAWTTLLAKVNAVTTALDDISQASTYATKAQELVAQMDATDVSLRLFKSYKAMVDGTTALGIVGDYDTETYMNTDATEQTAITALNTAFDAYAAAQTGNFDVSAFLGENLDFNAAAGTVLNGENNNTIKAVTGWEVAWADADTWAVLQTDQSTNAGKLYIRKNWGSAATTLTATKQKMLPVGKYRLSLSWNSNMENMNNLSAYIIDNVSTTIGKETNTNETLTYDFEVADTPKPFDLVFGFQKQKTGDNAAQILVDNVSLTYTPTVITLYDHGEEANNNANILSANANTRCVVTLSGRTLYKDGYWNTLCLPFDLPVAGSVLHDADIRTLSSASLENSTLTLNFTAEGAVTTLEAGKPYIVKWTSGSNITDPVFLGVTLSQADSPVTIQDLITFKGVTSPSLIEGEDHTKLYLGADNTLYYPNADMTINAFRAYFQLIGIEAGDPAASVRNFVLNFEEDEVITGIEELTHTSDLSPLTSDTWFTLDGRSLNGKPSVRGLYIYKGKKVIIK